MKLIPRRNRHSVELKRHVVHELRGLASSGINTPAGRSNPQPEAARQQRAHSNQGIEIWRF
jgi:hypothetical protein